MSSTIKTVTIYCASSSALDQHYFDLADQIGKILVEAGITVVYGGGAKGLMGQIADSVIANKGKIIGVMPHFMKAVEWNHKGVATFEYVESMAERKRIFLEKADALITLPGGCGTFEELLEAITLKRLGKFTKPIVIVNHKGYYDPLIQMLDRSVNEKFMREEHKSIWTVIEKPEQLIAAMKNASKWDASAINFAGL